MMNFSAFGGPFSGIHQFAAKFDAQTPGAFGTPPVNSAAAAAGSDNHVQRYQTNGNHFNQNVPNGKCLYTHIYRYTRQLYICTFLYIHMHLNMRAACCVYMYMYIT